MFEPSCFQSTFHKADTESTTIWSQAVPVRLASGAKAATASIRYFRRTDAVKDSCPIRVRQGDRRHHVGYWLGYWLEVVG